MGILDRVQSASKVEAKLKAIFWGSSGVGKTTTALMSEGPVLVIDTELGVQLYGDSYDFDVISTRNYKEVREILVELGKSKCMANGKKYNTIVLDSFTEISKLLDEAFLEQFKLKSGNSLYTFQPADYKHLNQAFKSLIDDILDLDANVIAICHEKANYTNGGMMVLDQLNPLKPSIPDVAPHYFDVTLHFVRKGDKYSVETTKSRIVDKDKRQALPAKFNNVDNVTFIQELMQYVRLNKKAPVKVSTEPKNVAEVDDQVDLNVILQQIYTKVSELQLSKTAAQKLIFEVTAKKAASDLTLEDATKLLNHLNGMGN